MLRAKDQRPWRSMTSAVFREAELIDLLTQDIVLVSVEEVFVDALNLWPVGMLENHHDNHTISKLLWSVGTLTDDDAFFDGQAAFRIPDRYLNVRVDFPADDLS